MPAELENSCVTREGMRIQEEQASCARPTSKLTVDDVIDDSIVREIEKDGFVGRLYRCGAENL
jgi:hypothetical protein